MSASGRLRVVGGALSGRRFARTIARGTRPTSDRVREAIASAIEARGGFQGTEVLDVFAGTGAMAIEALSRGAARATLIESDRAARKAIEQSLAELGLEDRARVLSIDLGRPAAIEGVFDRVFVDPPYAQASSVPSLLDALAAHLAPSAIVCVEHPSKVSVTLSPRFTPISAKRYGETSVLFATITSG